MFSSFKINQNKIIYKNKIAFFLKELNFRDKITLIDIGARSGLNKPFSYIDEKYLNIIGFEPDFDEYKKLKKTYKNRKYFNYAIDRKIKRSKFFLLKDEPASSLYKPNNNIGYKFEKQHFEKRSIKKIINLNTNKLDNYKDEIKKIDFLKIDTQGSEFDILEGANNILKNQIPIILTETWSEDIYQKAKKFYDIARFLDNYGFRAIKIDDAANWRYRSDLKFSDFDEPVRVGYEILFIKKTELLLKKQFKEIVKIAILLDLFGFKNLSYFLIKNHPKPIASVKKKYLSIINDLNNRDLFLSKGLSRIIIKILIKLKLMDYINHPLHT